MVPVAHNASLINVPVGWGASIDFGRYYIVQHNTILDPSTVQSQTYVSGLQTVGAQDILPKIFFAAIDIVGGSASFPQDLLSFVFLPIGYLLLIPISALAVYEICLKRSKRHFSSLDALILLSVSIFPIASLISSNFGNIVGSVLARGVFILLIALLLSVITDSGTRRGQTRKTKVALFFFLQIPFYMMYHTWALYLLVVMVGFLVFSLVVRQFELTRFSLFSVIAYGVVALYIYSAALLATPLYGLRSAFAGETTLNSLTTYGSYSSLSSVFSYIQAINIALLLFLILIFCVYFMLIRLKKRKAATSELLILFLVCDVFLLSFVLFTQGGIQTVLGRTMEFAFAVSLMCAAFVLGSNDKKYLSRITEVTAIIIVVLCITSFLTAQNATTTDLTQSEFTGIAFAGTHVQNNIASFSDFRLALVLLYYDQSAIYSDANLNNTSYQNVMQMYYSNTSSPHQALDPIIKNNQSYIIITSTHQAEVPLADSGPVALRPANADFQSNFINDRQFDRVYDSASASIFYRSR
ncbi:MAG: hypothetical protein ABSD89_04420 [Halobacteriota archaeon]